MIEILFVAAIFLAVFTQSLSGFGSALIAMSILPSLLGIRVATPLVALVSLSLEVVILYQYRHSIRIRKVLPIIAGSVVGIPIGVFFLKQVNETLVLASLGVVISGYAMYALMQIKLPVLDATFWAYLAGLVSGVLGGAYNVSGPPVIIYGDCRRWSPHEFKGNLQGYFLVSTLIVVITHWVSGNFTARVMQLYLLSIPAIIVGLIAGFILTQKIPSDVFRKITLWLLVIMGGRLIFSALFG